MIKGNVGIQQSDNRHDGKPEKHKIKIIEEKFAQAISLLAPRIDKIESIPRLIPVFQACEMLDQRLDETKLEEFILASFTKEIFGKAFTSVYREGRLPYFKEKVDTGIFDQQLERINSSVENYKKCQEMDINYDKKDSIEEIKNETERLIHYLNDLRASPMITETAKSFIDYKMDLVKVEHFHLLRYLIFDFFELNNNALLALF